MFWLIVLGGVSEFCVSLLVILSYFSAIKSNTNQGIGSAMISLNSVLVAILSWIFYGESLSCVQIFGIFVVVIGIILLGLFSSTKEDDDGPTLVKEDDGSSTMVLIYGLLAACALTVEMLANKHLSKGCGMDPKHGAVVGMCYLFVEGTLGTICLIVITCYGDGFHVMSGLSIILMAISAVFLYSSLVLLNYSIGIGLVGVAVSIFNSNAAIHTTISFFALHQLITLGQVWGLVLSLLGICVLTMGDMFTKCCCKGT